MRTRSDNSFLCVQEGIEHQEMNMKEKEKNKCIMSCACREIPRHCQ